MRQLPSPYPFLNSQSGIPGMVTLLGVPLDRSIDRVQAPVRHEECRVGDRPERGTEGVLSPARPLCVTFFRLCRSRTAGKFRGDSACDTWLKPFFYAYVWQLRQLAKYLYDKN